MRIIQNKVDTLMSGFPKIILEMVLKEKFQKNNVEYSDDLISDIATHLIENKDGPFQWGDGDDNVSMSFLDEDMDRFQELHDRLIASLPQIMETNTDRAARTLLKSLEDRWPEEHQAQIDDVTGFRTCLEQRWGAALNCLRKILTIAREMSRDSLEEKPISQSDSQNVLTRLHIRACQVTAEIITLLENGYADGAMARWRTLHEISLVFLLVKEHGDALARRYLDHHAVEAKAAKDRYQNCCDGLGYQPVDESACERIDAASAAVINKYGKDFGGPYGWAEGGFVEPATRGRRLGLGDIEAAAGRSLLASHYKFASESVHASPRALFFRLGSLDGSGFVAGASNAGLSEPGQATAHTMTLMSTLFLGGDPSFDDLTAMKVLQILGDEAPGLFAEAEIKLKQDHIKYSRSRKKQDGAPD